ncbi:MAG: FMN-binding protein [Bacillota bacterium]
MKKVAIMLLAMVLLASLVGCGGPKSPWKEGTFQGSAKGYGGDLEVAVTIKGGKIAEVKVTNHKETPNLGTQAIDKLPGEIVKAQNATVDAVSGATVTSTAIKQAVEAALAKAKN